MLATAAELNYAVFMLKPQTAFLNVDGEEDVFVKMAPGYEIGDKSGVETFKLKRSLYCLRQSPKS